MRDLKEDLRKIGVSEEIINHKAFIDLFSSHVTHFSANEYFYEIKDNEIIIKKIGESMPIQRIQKSYNGGVNIYGFGSSIEISISQDDRVQKRITRSKNPKTGWHREEIHEYMDNGLEHRFEENIINSFFDSRVNVTRVSREPNGYIAQVIHRTFNGKEGDINNTTVYEGYVNLDLRFPSMLHIGGAKFDDVGFQGKEGSVPYMITKDALELTSGRGFSKEAKEYILKGILDDSPESSRRWIEEYQKGLQKKEIVDGIEQTESQGRRR